MTNILLSNYDISQEWCYPTLKEYIKPNSKVAVIAYSFRDSEVPDAAAWQNLYGKNAPCRTGILRTLAAYGINENTVRFVDYFTDEVKIARAAVKQCDILYLPWGNPSRFMERILEKGLYKDMENFRGTVIGVAAGAQLQLSEYHFTPGKDSASFGYSLGLNFVSGIDVEVHYDPKDASRKTEACAVKAAEEKNIPVYALEETGAIVIHNGKIVPVGDVYCFKNKK
jgi:peptidase E